MLTVTLGASRAVIFGLIGGVAWLLVGNTAASATVSSPPCVATARACVDLSAQQAWLMRDGDVIYGPVPVATGKASAPTDSGIFRVFWKDRHHRSRLFDNAPMPYSVFYNGDEAFHEGNLTERSHGCVRLIRQDAHTFYNTLQSGDVVQVVR